MCKTDAANCIPNNIMAT
uniref:Uncharacterized protein n=1 Tax=Anguilla anguilla TaxID=7936 RepID=A0A0E9VKP3_ANGAN